MGQVHQQILERQVAMRGDEKPLAFEVSVPVAIETHLSGSPKITVAILSNITVRGGD